MTPVLMATVSDRDGILPSFTADLSTMIIDIGLRQPLRYQEILSGGPIYVHELNIYWPKGWSEIRFTGRIRVPGLAKAVADFDHAAGGIAGFEKLQKRHTEIRTYRQSIEDYDRYLALVERATIVKVKDAFYAYDEMRDHWLQDPVDIRARRRALLLHADAESWPGITVDAIKDALEDAENGQLKYMDMEGIVEHALEDEHDDAWDQFDAVGLEEIRVAANARDMALVETLVKAWNEKQSIVSIRVMPNAIVTDDVEALKASLRKGKLILEERLVILLAKPWRRPKSGTREKALHPGFRRKRAYA